MRKANKTRPESKTEVHEMLPEYHFDYSKARPNRFAAEIAEGSLIVVLEREIAQVFGTEEAVKAVLRAIAQAMPKAGGQGA
jgi:hypothetical protein